MKALPADPLARHARFISAICEDWGEAMREGRSLNDTPRADAVVEIDRQMRGARR